MKPEITYLVFVTILTATMWIPYVLDRIVAWGLLDSVGYPKSPKPTSSWSVRMKAAHSNAVENLVVFATLVLSANAVGVTNSQTILACTAYFWARVVHVVAYTFAIPWVRTLSFAVGWMAQMVIAWQVIANS